MLEKWFIDLDLLCYYKPSCGVLILYSNRFGVVTISYMTLGLEVLENFSLREKSLQIQISYFSIANEKFLASSIYLLKVHPAVITILYWWRDLDRLLPGVLCTDYISPSYFCSPIMLWSCTPECRPQKACHTFCSHCCPNSRSSHSSHNPGKCFPS